MTNWRYDEIEPPSVDAQFKALRDEIGYRTQAQLALFSLNVVAVGALSAAYNHVTSKLTIREPNATSNLQNNLPPAGVANVNSDEGLIFLLLLGLISASICLQWLDHAKTIDRLGNAARAMGVDWEKIVKGQRQNVFARLSFGLHVFITFGGSGIAALIVLRQSRNKLTDFMEIGWWVCVALVVLSTLQLGWFLVSPALLPRLKAATRFVWRIFDRS
jgi:hypothetical protein